MGDSILTDGVCLTVTALRAGGFSADVMPETVRRTTLSERRPGDRLNLERALTLQLASRRAPRERPHRRRRHGHVRHAARTTPWSWRSRRRRRSRA